MAWAAALFFWGRLAHWIVYIAAVPWARTITFAISWLGILIAFFAVLGAEGMPAAATG